MDIAECECNQSLPLLHSFASRQCSLSVIAVVWVMQWLAAVGGGGFVVAMDIMAAVKDP